MGYVVVAIIVVVGLLSMIPKTVWIVFGVCVAVGFATWAVKASAQRRAAEREAAAARQRKADARELIRVKQARVEAMGRKYAARVESALRAAQHVAESEAARDGWLGDVDFGADIAYLAAGFEKAAALQRRAESLSELRRPSTEDKRLIADAKRAAQTYERASLGQVERIQQCAKEARRIDESLQNDRDDARDARRRAELHGELSGLLYGAQAPAVTSGESALDGVESRVKVFHELRDALVRARS